MGLQICFLCGRYQRAPAVWMKPCRRVWFSWRPYTPNRRTTCPSSKNCRVSWTSWSIWSWRCLSGAIRSFLWITWRLLLNSSTGTGNHARCHSNLAVYVNVHIDFQYLKKMFSRWLGYLGLLLFDVIICLLILVGLIRNSRSILIRWAHIKQNLTITQNSKW